MNFIAWGFEGVAAANAWLRSLIAILDWPLRREDVGRWETPECGISLFQRIMGVERDKIISEKK